MLTPAEQLGLAGAALDARVRQAVNFIPDSTLVHVARRLAEDARASDVVYVHDGAVETVRVMLRPLLVMPEQLGYLHHVCTRIMSALARFPELYARDADVRSALPLADDERAWFDEVWPAVAHAETPLYGRLDAVCDFTSARWQDSLKFMEPNLSGVGGIHLGSASRDARHARRRADAAGLRSAARDRRTARSARSVPAGAARSRAHDRQQRQEPSARRAEVRRRRPRRAIASRRVLPRAARHRARACGSARAAAHRRRRLLRRRANRRRLSRLRDPRPAGARAGRRPAARRDSRACSLQNRMVSAIGGDLDHKSCWEVLTSDELASRYFSIAERQLFRRHVLWTRIVSERRTDTPDGPMDLLEYARDYREELVLKPNRGYGGAGVHLGAALSQSEWEALLGEALAAQHDPHRQWVVQAAATLPVHLFPVLDEQGRTHEEPFYAVMGFAPTDHGLGIIARVSQKQVVNVAQRGGLAAVLVGYRPEDLKSSTRSPVQPDLAAQELRAAVQRLRDLDGVDSSARVGRGDVSAARCRRGSRLAARRPRCAAARALGRRPARRSAGRARGAPKISRRASAWSSSASAASGGPPSRCRRVSSRRSPKRARIASRLGKQARRDERLRRVPESVRAAAQAHARAGGGAAARPTTSTTGCSTSTSPACAARASTRLLQATGARLRTLVPELAERTRRYAQSAAARGLQPGAAAAVLRRAASRHGLRLRARPPRPLDASVHDDGRRRRRAASRFARAPTIRCARSSRRCTKAATRSTTKGLPRELHGTLLADAPSMGVHESQARLWENHVGRSAAFWRHYFAPLQARVPRRCLAASMRAAFTARSTSSRRASTASPPTRPRTTCTCSCATSSRSRCSTATSRSPTCRAPGTSATGITSASAPAAARRLPAGRALGVGRVRLLPDLHDRQPVRGAARRRVRRKPRPRCRARERQPGSAPHWLAEQLYAHGAALPAEALIERITGRTLDVEPFFRRLERRVAELE